MAAPAHYLADEAARKATTAAREMVEALTKRVSVLERETKELRDALGIKP